MPAGLARSAELLLAALAQIPPDADLTALFIAERNQAIHEPLTSTEIGDADYHIDDRLGQKPGDGGAADVFDVQLCLLQPRSKPSRLLLE